MRFFEYKRMNEMERVYRNIWCKMFLQDKRLSIVSNSISLGFYLYIDDRIFCKSFWFLLTGFRMLIVVQELESFFGR